jgi:hypothetical protein
MHFGTNTLPCLARAARPFLWGVAAAVALDHVIDVENMFPFVLLAVVVSEASFQIWRRRAHMNIWPRSWRETWRSPEFWQAYWQNSALWSVVLGAALAVVLCTTAARSQQSPGGERYTVVPPYSLGDGTIPGQAPLFTVTPQPRCRQDETLVVTTDGKPICAR